MVGMCHYESGSPHLVGMCHYERGSPHLVGMCHYERALVREVVVEIGDDLNGHICLACARRTHNLQRTTRQLKYKWVTTCSNYPKLICVIINYLECRYFNSTCHVAECPLTLCLPKTEISVFQRPTLACQRRRFPSL